MYCRVCGNKISDNAEVCIKCGCKPLIGKSYCQNCGAITTAQQVMCTKCKSNLKSVATKNNQTNKGSSKFGKVLIILGIILLVYTIFYTLLGFITYDFIYDLVYAPEYFFSEDISKSLIFLFISIALLVLGKRLNRGKKK